MCEEVPAARVDSTANLGMVVLAVEVEAVKIGLYFTGAGTILLLTLNREENNIKHQMKGGRNGSNGSPGTRPSTYLTGGKASVLSIPISVVSQ
jgi:hypothetical protein